MDFRNVKRDDWGFILELRNSFFNKFHKQNSPIKLKEHEKYMKLQIKNKKFQQWIIIDHESDIGYIRILEEDVSILLKKEFQGKGVGTKVLRKLEKQSRLPKKLIGEIKANNISSIKTFEKAGYKLKTLVFEKNLQKKK
jgi:RimJ/RimL family protein N-acetyltransferase